ncbi:transmembrane signal receptor [Lithospermum erythrorhizon]|uniref:Transmembrane signal receptor n=1 Tax=Lithospermum erythrorhizon TaxID=34254 RepID=A0AAV3PDW8_LITER
MKDLGVLKYFLRVEIVRSQEGIFLSQRKCALDIISEAGLLGCKPVGFLMEQNQQLASSSSAMLKDSESYRRSVGHLLYLSFTRPDFLFAVHVLSQFLHQPCQDHWSAARRVFKYLKGCPVFLGDFPVSWKTKKQVRVSRSSAEAEYGGAQSVLYFLCDAVLDGIIRTTHVSTTNKLADIFTKALGKRQFDFLLPKLGIFDLHAPT